MACPDCAQWKAERDKAVTHAMKYGPQVADMLVEMRDWQEIAERNHRLLEECRLEKRHLIGDPCPVIYPDTGE